MAEKPDVESMPWEPPNRDRLAPDEYVRALESKLSAIIDAKDVPGWTVNPAFDPAVNAFIQSHANNAAFLKKALAMQQNRASYFVAARAQASQPKPKRVNKPATDRFGHLLNAPAGQINAVLTDQPQTVAEIARKCNLTAERVLQHFDTWFGTDRPLGRCLKRENDPGRTPRGAERYWLEEKGTQMPNS
ncbi:MAG: hypothetical protein K2R98_30050 [Gemmataceae bacterium]|nr:hypothetical protein [Gemmataceae bacterium]